MSEQGREIRGESSEAYIEHLLEELKLSEERTQAAHTSLRDLEAKLAETEEWFRAAVDTRLQVEAKLADAERCIRAAWWRLKNPDMGGTYVGKAKDILDNFRRNENLLEMVPAEALAESEASAAARMDLLETAWGVIANAGAGDWDTEAPTWKESAKHWRDRYHAQLESDAGKDLLADFRKCRDVLSTANLARPSSILEDALEAAERWVGK